MLRRTKILIVGGGLQACALAAQLAYRGHQDFVLVDPSPLMSTWFQGMRAQGLKTLRTPYSAHIGPEGAPDAMWRMRHSGKPTADDLAKPASVVDFNEYSTEIISRFRLEDHRLSGWVTDIMQGDDLFVTKLISGDGEVQIISDIVVVAIGLGQPVIPDGPSDWRVKHSDAVVVDDLDLAVDDVCILGGGLTAGTLAIKYADWGARVILVSRSPITVSQLEADAEWIPGRKLAEQFLSTDDWDERARQLTAARVGRGVTPEVWQELTQAVDAGDIQIIEGVEVRFWEKADDDKLRIPQIDEVVDQIVCATGYRHRLEDVPFLATLRGKLQTTRGLPHVGENFDSEDIPGLYFMGKLGELGGGPLSRNVPGARIAAERIANDLGIAPVAPQKAARTPPQAPRAPHC